MEKLNFLKNKWIAFGSIVVLAIFLLVNEALGWSNSFTITGLVSLFIELGFLALVVLGIFLKKKGLLTLSIGAFLASIGISVFYSMGETAKAFIDLHSGGLYITYSVMYCLGALMLLGSLALLFVKEFKADFQASKLLNTIFCLVSFTFALVGFILLLCTGANSGTAIMTGLTLLLLPCVDVVVSFNLELE